MLSVILLYHYADVILLCHYGECHYDVCHYCCVTMLSVVLLLLVSFRGGATFEMRELNTEKCIF